MGMGQFKKRGNAKSLITAVITAVITAREYYREAPWYFSRLYSKHVKISEKASLHLEPDAASS